MQGSYPSLYFEIQWKNMGPIPLCFSLKIVLPLLELESQPDRFKSTINEKKNYM